MSADLRQFAEDGLAWIKERAPAGLEAELYLERGQERGIELREGAIDAVEQAQAEGLGLRLCQEGRMAFASAGGLSRQALETAYAQALAQLPHLASDPARRLPGPRPAADEAGLRESLNDKALFEEGWDSLLPRLAALEDALRAGDPRIDSVPRLGYGEARGETVVASTTGVLAREEGGSCSVGATALAGPDEDRQAGSAYQSARRKERLDFGRVAGECARRTVALLDARKEPGRKRAVIFDPWMAGEFLELIAGLLCADQVQRGKSLLAGRLGQSVASSLVTFVDDSRLPEGLASSLYDDEGQATGRKVMIENGVVREFFHDSYTANRDKRGGNASAGRGSYKGMPGPGSSNFYLAPGRTRREDIVRQTKDGILLMDVMGMHMADPISGEFSVGVSGLAVADGKLAGPVKNAMVSGNLLELLSSIDLIGDDLTFHGSLGAPTFRVAGINVA